MASTSDVYAFVTQMFKNIALAKVATSAEEAKGSATSARPMACRSIAPASSTRPSSARSASPNAGYHPPVPRAYKLPGESGIATLHMMVNTLVAGKYATEHDAKIALKLATVLCGGASGSHPRGHRGRDARARARGVHLACAASRCSQARMQYMLQNNKPLRN